jgi:tRNA pseudouridine38-40 synthase
MRFKLILEYDGTRYSGWQQQADAKTIQGALLAAADQIFAGQPLDLQGCGRTDAGVHGLRYVAHLEVTTDSAPAAMAAKLNECLPADIVILAVEPVHPRFHARHSCVGRSYLYQIARRRTAFCRRYVHYRPEPLAAERMAAAAGLLAGMHDFAAFTDRRVLKNKSSKVFVNEAEAAAVGDLVLFRIVGSHFLWKMIRHIVGVLMEIGAGRMEARDLEELLAGRGELPAGLLAPPTGLFLEAAFYDEDAFSDFLATEPLRPLFF